LANGFDLNRYDMGKTITQQPIIDQLLQYLETKLKLYKLEGVEKASAIIAGILTGLITVVLVLLTFILLSITLALLAGELLHSGWEGFACVTGFYVLLVLAARLLNIRLQNLFIRLFIQKVL